MEETLHATFFPFAESVTKECPFIHNSLFHPNFYGHETMKDKS